MMVVIVKEDGSVVSFNEPNMVSLYPVCKDRDCKKVKYWNLKVVLLSYEDNTYEYPISEEDARRVKSALLSAGHELIAVKKLNVRRGSL